MSLTATLSAVFIFFLVPFLALGATETKGFLTNEDIDLFYNQGYLLKKDCLSRIEIEQLNENITTIIDRALKEIQQSNDRYFTDADQIIYIDGSRVVFNRRPDQSISIARVNGVSGMQPTLLETMRSEKMVRTFFELLNTSDLEHLISQLHPKLPGDQIAYPKHRDIQFRKSFDPDWQDVLGNGSYAVCLIPIDPMTQENGGLWVDKNNYPVPQGLEEELVWIDAKPGDLLFMHPYLFHGSGPNTSSTASRKTLLTGFCAFGANHKQYPGTDVNVRVTLMEDGTIAMQPILWNQTPSPIDINH